MASALTVLLGCWLAGRSGALGQGFLPKPSISVSPGGVIPVGGKVTIRCWHQRLGMRFLLYKDGDGNHPTYTDPASYVAEFPIPSARREDGGSYTCRYSHRTGPAAYSEPSDPVQIIVADPSLPRPSISLSPTGVTAAGADVTIRCQGPPWDVRFFLHKAGDLNPPRHMDPAGDGAEFHIPTVGRQHGGSYGCSYRPRSEPFVSSQPSHPVQLVVAGGTHLTQPGAAPAPTHAGRAGSGGSKSQAPSGLTSPIIAGASAAAAVLLLILLILVAFLCFRKTRDRKEAAPRPRSTIPLRMLKAPAQQDPIYSSVDEGKETQTLPQEPDPGTDGLTYAELDRQALHAKPGGPAPAPEPTQPSVYAAINVSRGAPQ
nr:leukocyte immunoglobulin-like receptor subfamily B member 5 isoform X2 [Caretta caretta]